MICISLYVVALGLYLRQCHFGRPSPWDKVGLQHHIPSHVHGVLEVTLHFIQNVLAGAAQQDCASFGVFALYQKCKVPENNKILGIK